MRSQQQDRMYLDSGNKHACRRRRFEFYCGRHYPTCAVVKFGFNFFTRWCKYYSSRVTKRAIAAGVFTALSVKFDDLCDEDEILLSAF